MNYENDLLALPFLRVMFKIPSVVVRRDKVTLDLSPHSFKHLI